MKKSDTLNLSKIKIRRKLVLSENHFLSLARSIISQQISTKAATSINARFLALFNGRKPSPKLLLNIPEAELRSAGLSRSKVIYLVDLANKFLDKTINPKLFEEMTDAEIKEHLVRVKGVGPWTADMFLIFALNRPDVLPLGDLAIKKGFQKAFNLRSTPTEKTMLRLAKAHQGNHTNLSLYLWQILDDK